ncbi:MAG: sigma 54-interacting transcriptional regulator [Nitrospirae bacterium]|nr:sigma 54-interacting transcriptional regulator [Nitrospirota bacterium]
MADAGILLIDRHHCIKWMNHQAVELVGALEIGKKRVCYRTLQYSDKFCAICPTGVTIDNGIATRYELPLYPNGQQRILEITGLPINDASGAVSMVMELIVDVTKKNMKCRIGDKGYEAYHGITGNSNVIKGVINTIQAVKDIMLPVLITGESGTGKELVARALHFDSARKERPFIAINCASLRPELLENELFGHVNGAFTGAIKTKEGLIKASDGGTLFIDEIADMSQQLQASLLRFIETGVFRPLGSTKEIKVNVKILAAINKNIEEEVKAGRFRLDLYHRMNVCRIDIPPLRQRREDIPILIRHFFATSPVAKNKGNITFLDDAIDALKSYHWTGNIRELFNVLTKACLLNNTTALTRRDVSELIHSACSANNSYPASLNIVTQQCIKDTLAACGWNISRAAKLLGIDRRTLYRKIEKIKTSSNVYRFIPKPSANKKAIDL